MAARKKTFSNASNVTVQKSAPVGKSSTRGTSSLDRELAAGTGSTRPLSAGKAETSSRRAVRDQILKKGKKPNKAATDDVAKQRVRKSSVKKTETAKTQPVASHTKSAKSTVAPARAKRKSEVTETYEGEMKPVSAPATLGNIPIVTGVATAAATAVVVNSGADARPTPKAPAPLNPQKLAAPNAAPASAKSDKDEQNGEQKAMKTSTNRHGFKLNEFVVYPSHGVGQIVTVEEQEVAGFKLELFVINFVKDKMTLRVPTSKVAAVGMRKLSDADAARRSLEILTGRARVKRTMWSRRAQEYEAKINSGDINAIAEVVRDLFRSDAQPEQSYSERQLYEAALDRMMREIAAVHKLTETEALKMIETQLKKNAKRTPKADATGAEAEDADIEEAA